MSPSDRQRDRAREGRARSQATLDAAALDEVSKEIFGRAPEHDVVPSLDRIAAVCELMGDPQRAFRVVHITGTNGKTSTARMVERLLREHGLRTGRFTSPHLTSVRERISLDGEPLSPAQFVGAYREVLPYVEIVDARSAAAGQPRMTFFEVLVAMAYAAFADAPVDVAVVEVGLGGSWDATNVADGEVAVITPISLDHTRLLGPDVTSIATEKSGIIKPGATVVLADQTREAAEVLLERAARVGAAAFREGLEFGVLGRDVAVGGQQLSLQGLGVRYDDIYLPLYGEYQAHNAAAALAAAEAVLGAGRRDDITEGRTSVIGLDVRVVRAAFADVASPGRLEVVRRSPTVLVDAAHNPAGAAALATALEESFSFTRLIGLVAIMADKDVEGILEALAPALDGIVVTRSSSARSMPVGELEEIAADIFGEDRVRSAQRLDEALEAAVTMAEEDGSPVGGVIATGSIPLAAEVRLLLGVQS
jgi:dihydrofolate synthase/folylpolyglutamate synthase